MRRPLKSKELGDPYNSPMSLTDALLLDPYAVDLSRGEVWIAARTDGVAGSGTQNDPYDGSTQTKFDTLLNDTHYLNYHPNTRIHLGPGTFQTSGFQTYPGLTGVLPEAGWKIIGSGMEVTVLRLVGAVNNSANATIGNNNPLDYFEVWDLTIDCNVSGQGSQVVVCTALSLVGAHIRLRRIRAINFASQISGRECFAVVPTQTPSSADVYVDCWINDCILEQPGLNSATEATLINVAGGESSGYVTGYHRGCGIRNCFVNAEYRTNPVPIASITYDSGTGQATVTTRLPHGHAAGDYVRITGAAVSGTNSYNGSYPILSVTPPYQFQYQPIPAPSGPPTGDMWLGRFPSLWIPITGIITQAFGSQYQITITTLTPHFLVPGQTAIISGIITNTDSNPNDNPLNGVFSVQPPSPWSPTQFVYVVQSLPTGTIEPSGFIGTTFQACSADGGTAAVVEGNRFVNVVNGGPYHDTYSSKDITVRNNYQRGVHVGPSQALGHTDLGYWATRTCNLSSSGNVATLIATDGFAIGFVVGETVYVPTAGDSNYEGYFTVASVGPGNQLTFDITNGPYTSTTGEFARLFQEGRMVIENNIIEVGFDIFNNGYSPTAAIWFYNNIVAPPLPKVAPPPYLYDQVVIRRNIIHSLDGAVDPSTYPYGLRLDMCAKGIVEESIVDLNSYPWPPIWQVRSDSITYLNNQTSAGSLIPGQIQIRENPPPQQYAEVEELATLIDFACVL